MEETGLGRSHETQIGKESKRIIINLRIHISPMNQLKLLSMNLRKTTQLSELKKIINVVKR